MTCKMECFTSLAAPCERRVELNEIYQIVFFLVADSSASEFYVPTFRKLRSIFIRPMKMEQCSDTSAHKIQTRGITQKRQYNIHNKATV